LIQLRLTKSQLVHSFTRSAFAALIPSSRFIATANLVRRASTIRDYHPRIAGQRDGRGIRVEESH
jgi:hypothetical protein